MVFSSKNFFLNFCPQKSLFDSLFWINFLFWQPQRILNQEVYPVWYYEKYQKGKYLRERFSWSFIFLHLLFFFHVLFLKFIMALCVFISTHCTYKSGKFPFSDFYLVKKKDWLCKNLTKLSTYPCEQNLSIYNMSDEINQEKSITLYCVHLWPKILRLLMQISS